jgi:hypothetical protein
MFSDTYSAAAKSSKSHSQVVGKGQSLSSRPICYDLAQTKHKNLSSLVSDCITHAANLATPAPTDPNFKAAT